jgi:hypothetical protein
VVTTYQSFDSYSTRLTHGFFNPAASRRQRLIDHDRPVVRIMPALHSEVVQSGTAYRVSAMREPATACRAKNAPWKQQSSNLDRLQDNTPNTKDSAE